MELNWIRGIGIGLVILIGIKIIPYFLGDNTISTVIQLLWCVGGALIANHLSKRFGK